MSATLVGGPERAGSAAATAGRQGAGTSLRVTQWRVLRSEWTKFRSLRSTLWTLLVTVVLMVGLGALISAVGASAWDDLDPGRRATFDPVGASLSGVGFAQLAVGVLGVLVISGEYSTGMVRASLTAVPRRLPVLWAKLAVFAVVTFAVTLVAALVAFLVGQALLDGAGLGVSLSADGALRSVIGSALYLTVAGLTGLAIGTVLRSTAAAISTFVGVFFVLPPLTQLLPDSWTSQFVQYLPSTAGSALTGSTVGIENALEPWAGFAVLCAYAVVMIGIAAVRLRRTDA